LSASVFPPIFRAPVRVGVVGEEVIARSGISRGVWVNAGSDPTSARILVAGELREGVAVSLSSSDTAELWRIDSAAKTDDSGDCDRTALPLAALDVWVAYAPSLEDAILPQPSDVLEAILDLADF
jgi:hypothetical protein